MLSPRSSVTVVVVFVLAASASVLRVAADPRGDAAVRKHIQETLAKLAKGEDEWLLFSVTYDDLHPLHGGLTLTIHGSGKVAQKAVGGKVGKPKDVTKEALKDLVEVLLKHKAWEQREAERAARPDESRALLNIRYKDHSIAIWEWHNDLAKNKRLEEIREAMKKAAWQTTP